MELILTRLGHDIDVTAAELAVFHRNRCKLNRCPRDGVEGNRKREAGKVARKVQAKGVGSAHSINCKRVGTAGSAETTDGARLVAAVARRADTDPRIESDNVANLARC